MNVSKGNTLIELMIAMVLGIILIGASITLFLIVKKTLFVQDKLAHAQENARLVNTILGEAIRESGNGGCNTFDASMVFRVHSPIDPIATGLESLTGIEMTFYEGREALWVKTVRPRYLLEEDSQGEEGYLIVSGSNKKLEAPKIIAISDCSHIDFFLMEKDSESLGKGRYKLSFSALKFSKSFRVGAQVGIFSSKLFYVKNKKLYSKEYARTPSILLEGISGLRFSCVQAYGIGIDLWLEGSMKKWGFKWLVKGKENRVPY